jgi:sortase A
VEPVESQEPHGPASKGISVSPLIEMVSFEVSKMLRSVTELNLRHCIDTTFTPSTTSPFVSPSDVSVLQARSQPSLTLVTCYPFYFVGDAPQRYVVQASLVNSEQTTISELNQEIPKPNKEETQ